MSEEVWMPYEGKDKEKWYEVTRELIREHPLDMKEVRNIVLESWDEIFTITNASEDFKIGENVYPKPQMMGFFLEELITQKIHKLDPKTWVADRTGYSKDLENISEPKYSVEIKTSSSLKNIYGNRSYGQKGDSTKKSKDGYYLAVNFSKFQDENKDIRPKVTMIRFGYLNYTDWKGQQAETGQQARIKSEVENVKLLPIYIDGDFFIDGPPLKNLKEEMNLEFLKYYDYTVKDLKTFCKENNLAQSGSKSDLKKRAFDYLKKIS